MEAYRRLAAVTDPADVDDLRSEWLDRYGPLPAPAEGLLDVARLRAECVRSGVRSVSVQRGVARVVGPRLPESRKVRLRRLVPRATVKPATTSAGPADELVVPLAVAPGEVAAELVRLLRELIPAAGDVPVGSPPP